MSPHRLVECRTRGRIPTLQRTNEGRSVVRRLTRKALSMASVASMFGVLVAIAGPATPASAATGDSMAAVVLGGVGVPEPCPNGIGNPVPEEVPPIDALEEPCEGAEGAFTGVTLQGTFVAGSGGSYVGAVCTAGISFTTTQTLLRGKGAIHEGTFGNDACGAGDTGTGVTVLDTCDITETACMVGRIDEDATPSNGSDGGSFVRVGTVAVALFELKWTINGTASGATTAAFVGAAVPEVEPVTSVVTGVVAGSSLGGSPVDLDDDIPNDILWAECAALC